MSLKKLYIKNRSHLSYTNNLLKIKTDKCEDTICLDEIDTILIENTQSTLSTALLPHLTRANISVIFCDEKFMPSALLLGLNQNSRTTKIQRAQILLSQPKKNRLWQSIVRAKVANQAAVLKHFGLDSQRLTLLLPKIKSNDKEYIESLAASYYFKALFGDDFTRGDLGDGRNSALNFGYTLFRSALCRYIVAYGLNPALGIHHHSELNAFNLADDLIEPFRPLVDSWVKREITPDTELTSSLKARLLNLLDEIITYEDRELRVSYGMKLLVANYQSICLAQANELKLFEL